MWVDQVPVLIYDHETHCALVHFPKGVTLLPVISISLIVQFQNDCPPYSCVPRPADQKLHCNRKEPVYLCAEYIGTAFQPRNGERIFLHDIQHNFSLVGKSPRQKYSLTSTLPFSDECYRVSRFDYIIWPHQ